MADIEVLAQKAEDLLQEMLKITNTPERPVDASAARKLVKEACKLQDDVQGTQLALSTIMRHVEDAANKIQAKLAGPN